MLAASRRPHNPNKTTDDIGWDSGDLSCFLTGVDINGKFLLKNDTKLSNKSIDFYQTAPKRELVAEIIRTFNHNQLNLLNGIFHIQKCNDRLIHATKNRNKTFIQLNNKIKHLQTRQNTLYSLLFKAMHPLPANDIINSDLNDGILQPTQTPLKQSQSHTIPLAQFDNIAPKQTQQPNKQIINNKIIIKTQSADMVKNIVETPDLLFKINNKKIQISNTSQQTQPSSNTQSKKLPCIVDELLPQTKLKTQTKINTNDIIDGVAINESPKTPLKRPQLYTLPLTQVDNIASKQHQIPPSSPTIDIKPKDTKDIICDKIINANSRKENNKKNEPQLNYNTLKPSIATINESPIKLSLPKSSVITCDTKKMIKTQLKSKKKKIKPKIKIKKKKKKINNKNNNKRNNKKKIKHQKNPKTNATAKIVISVHGLEQIVKNHFTEDDYQDWLNICLFDAQYTAAMHYEKTYGKTAIQEIIQSHKNDQ